MVSKLTFEDYWDAHWEGHGDIPRLYGKTDLAMVFNDAQRIERGWGVHGSCSRCSSDESPRTTATLCRKCYQNERKAKKKGGK